MKYEVWLLQLRINSDAMSLVHVNTSHVCGCIAPQIEVQLHPVPTPMSHCLTQHLTLRCHFIIFLDFTLLPETSKQYRTLEKKGECVRLKGSQSGGS